MNKIVVVLAALVVPSLASARELSTKQAKEIILKNVNKKLDRADIREASLNDVHMGKIPGQPKERIFAVSSLTRMNGHVVLGGDPLVGRINLETGKISKQTMTYGGGQTVKGALETAIGVTANVR